MTYKLVKYDDNDNVTWLSWDSISVEGHHINEVHISIATVPPTSYVLQLGMIMLPQSHIQACFDVIVATYWKRRSSQEDGDDVSIYEFLVDYITDNLYISEIDV